MRIAALERGELVGVDPRDRLDSARLPRHATMVDHVARTASEAEFAAARYGSAAMLLALEVAAARAVGALSRLDAAAAAARPCPGSCSSSVDPGAVDAARGARCRAGSVLVSATNGKTTTTAMVAEILGAPARLQPLRREPPLRGRLDAARRAAAPSSGCSRSTRRRCPRSRDALRPRVVALGNLFRDQLDRYGELELVAERLARGASRELPEALLVVNADDPLLGELARGRAATRSRYGLDDPAHARAALQHAADSTLLPRLRRARTSTRPSTSATSATTAAPPAAAPAPPLDVAAREIELRGLDGQRVHARHAGEARRGSSCALPGPLQRLQRDRGRGGRARARRRRSSEIVAGLGRFVAAFGRFERIAVGDKRLLMLLIKNPAGANEAVADAPRRLAAARSRSSR